MADLVFTFQRVGDTSVAETINFSVGGTATFGTDYTVSGAASFNASTGSVIMLAGASSKTLTVTPTPDSAFEGDETVSLTITSTTSGTIGTTGAVTGTILNDDTPVGDPNFSAVKLLLLFNGSNGSTTFTDSSNLSLTVTAQADARLTTTDPKFGSAALLLDGTADYVLLPTNSGLNIGSGDFTIEFFAKPAVSVSSGAWNLFHAPGGAGGIGLSSGRLLWWQDGVGAIATGTTVLAPGNYYYVAVKRSGSTLTLWLNGSLEATGTGYTESLNFSQWTIGASAFNSYWNGRIDAFRLTSVARDVSSVPSVEFPTF